MLSKTDLASDLNTGNTLIECMTLSQTTSPHLKC